MANRRQRNPASSRRKEGLLPLIRSKEDVLQIHSSLIPILLSARGPHVLLLLVLIFFTCVASPAYAIRFNAYWNYKQSGGQDRDTLTEFQQRYSLGVGQAIQYRPSHAITASASVGYTRTQSDAGKGMFSTDSIATSAQASLVNDIFLAQISGRTDIRLSGGGDQSQTSWSTTLASNWSIPFMPALRFSYSEYVEPVSGVSLIATGGQKEKNTSMSVNWDLVLAQFSYQFSNNESEDPLGNSLSSTDSHFARAETEGQFWNRRLIFNVSQQFGHSTQDVTIGDEGGFFDIPLEGTTLSKVTIPGSPEDLKPDDADYVDPNSQLPQAVDVNERLQLYIDFGLPEQVNILRLTLFDSFSATQALELTWELYTRADQFDQWELALDNLQSIRSITDENSIDITLDLNAEEIILVAQNTPSAPLTFTAFSGFTQITESLSTENTNSLTNLGLGYRITQNLRATANLTLDNNETDSQGTITDSNRRTLSGNLRWSPSPFISPGLNFSEYMDDSSIGPENINRVYSLNIATYPMETLDVSFIVTHVDRFSDDLKNFTSDRYSIVTRAQIYPDLTANWNLTRLESQELRDDGMLIDTTRSSSNLRLYADLTRSLTADFGTNYSVSESNIATSELADAVFSLHYRPSALLSARGSYATYFLESTKSDEWALNLYLQVVNTDKTRVSFRSNHRVADRTSNNFSLVGSWDISRHLTMSAQANYTITDTQSYNFRINLSLWL